MIVLGTNGGAGGAGGFGGGGGGFGTSVSGSGGAAGFGGGAGGSKGGGGGGAGLGGAIFNDPGATVTITNSTLTANAALGGKPGFAFGNSGGDGSGFGGALFNYAGTVTITNSTLDGNSVGVRSFPVPIGNGGAVYNLADTTGQTATVNLFNSILADSPNSSDLAMQQLAGTAVVNAAAPHVNIVQNSNILAGTFNNSGVLTSAPNLGALGNNGGPTFTMLPNAGSPAIDAGSNADAAGLLVDQRDFFSRIVNGTVDLGAVEAGSLAAAPPAITSANATTFTIGFAGTFTVRTTPGNPAATTLTESVALPSGVTFTDNGDGTATLAGTPAAGTSGVVIFTITASNSLGLTSLQSFTLTIDQAPTLGSLFSMTTPVPTRWRVASPLRAWP